MLGILSYKTWLIEPMFANRMAPIILRSIQQGSIEKFFKQNRESNEKVISSFYAGLDAQIVFDWDDGVPPYRVAKSSSGKKVAIVTMLGAITKNGDACSYGMRDYQNVMSKIAKDPEVAGVVFHFNNAPGGSHDGTQETGYKIGTFPKNTVGFVDGYAASAHYWMASQTKHIMMNSLLDSEVGSIGSLIISENVQNMIEAGNFPSIEIFRAPQSYNKALFNYIEPVSKKVRAELDEDLRLGVEGFISAVKAGRGDKLKDDSLMFTGKMYPTDEAIANGLADSKGSLQDAINKAAESSASAKPKASSISNSTNNNSMSLKSKVSSFFNPKKEEKKSAEGDAPAAEDNTPRWTDTMVFNTDGSGDGAFCLHEDSEGNDRKFETKTDANTGNEPPTDPATTEDDNWSAVAEAAAAGDASESKAQAKAEVKEETSVTKLNVALKAANAKAKKAEAEIVSLTTKVATLEQSVKDLQKKMDETPAAPTTNIIQKEEKKEARKETPADQEAQQYAEALNNNFL
ncbi:MAG TPA: S49 family peptidase [Chryseolinea sp.]|nr:S49 family peptidase [Chryseolinea sp.]